MDDFKRGSLLGAGVATAALLTVAYAARYFQTGRRLKRKDNSVSRALSPEEEDAVNRKRRETEEAKQKEDEAWNTIQGYNAQIAYAPKETRIGMGGEGG